MTGPFYKPCYGSLTNWAYPYGFNGSAFGGGAWGGNYSAGVYSAPFVSAQTGPYWGSNFSHLDDEGWGYYGHGSHPKTSCFKPTGANSTLRYVFSNLNFTVNMSLTCARTHSSSIAASYNVTIEGDLYDFSTPHSLWPSAPMKVIQGGSVSCAGSRGGAFAKTFHLPGPFVWTEKTASLVTSDEYWFEVGAGVGVSAQAPVTNSSAGAFIQRLTIGLTTIDCPAC